MIIRENFIYLFIFLFGYGLYGAGITANNNFQDLIYFIVPIPFFLSIYLFKKNNEIIFNFEYSIFTNKNLIYLLLIIIILLILASQRFFLSIADDEYAYVGLGLIHSNYIISKILDYEFLKDFKVKYLYHFISLIILLSIFLYFTILNKFLKNNHYFQVILTLIIVIFFRYLILNAGGNSFPHPPLLALSPILSTALFGLSDVSLKITPFLIYSLLAFYYFLKLKNRLNEFYSFVIVIGLFSIPGILYIGILVEQSLFSLICFSIISIELVTNKKPNYKKKFIIILFFSLFRILSILSIMLIFFDITFKSNSLKNLFENIFKTLRQAYPLLLAIPFLIFSFTANEDLTVDRVGSNFINFEYFYFVLPYTLINNFTILPGVLLIIFVLGLIYKIKNTLFLLLFLFLNILIYGNVIPSDNKYVYEIFFPVFLASILIYLVSFEIKWLKNIFLVFFLTFIFSNTLILKKFNSICLDGSNPYDLEHKYITNFGCKIIYAHPFDLKISFKYLKNQNDFSFSNIYIPGIYYGIMPSIINGMNISEYRDHKIINQNQNQLNVGNKVNWLSGSAKNINQDNNINFILLADLPNSQKLEKDLVDSGWYKIYEDINKNFNTITTVLKKK